MAGLEGDDDEDETWTCPCGAENADNLDDADEDEEDSEPTKVSFCGKCGAARVEVVPQ